MNENGQRFAPPPDPESALSAPALNISLPPGSAARESPEASRFGIGVSLRPDEPNVERRLRLLQDVGARWWRQQLSWAEVEPTPGRFEWSRWDAIVASAERLGVAVLPVLMHEPRWVGIDTRDAVDAFARFAGTAAERYRGHVKYWQIWHEPNTRAWDSTPGQYARFLVAAARAIRNANP
ncbi:MAG: hypothetical protein ACUVRO_15305, partial [Armatimonadota bacterium]